MVLTVFVFIVVPIFIPASSSSKIDRTIFCRNNSLEKLIEIKRSNLDFNGFDTFYRLVFSTCPSNNDVSSDIQAARNGLFKATYLDDYRCKPIDDKEKKQFLESYATQIYLHLFHPGRCILDPAYGNFVNFLFDTENNAVRQAACKKLPDEMKMNCKEKAFSRDIFKYYFERINISYPASESMTVFKFLRDDTVDVIKTDISGLKVIEKGGTTAKSFAVPLVKELMTSNLLMNNYGRVVRELKTRMSLYCQQRAANPDSFGKNDTFKEKFLTYAVRCKDESTLLNSEKTLVYNEIAFCVSIENFYTFVRCFFIAISCIVNVYMLLTLEVSNKSMEIISVRLIRLLFASNVIFLTTDIWFIVESFYPIIPPGNNYHFVQAEGAFDGDLWDNVTYYVSMESVRMTMDFRVEKSDFNMSDTSFSGIAIRTILVVQNTLLNISRTYAGSINFCVMFFVLYDLRRSYHGFLKSSALLWFKGIVGSMFVIVTVLYIAAGALQFIVLTKVNEHVKETNSMIQNMKITNTSETPRYVSMTFITTKIEKITVLQKKSQATDTFFIFTPT
uniref:G_PROTEIN_RECEP_F1_2 domain-containing protein n=1 Tax=Panagrellus redivivus TaxID=6233 RepID=A0A7E4UM79_PANRE